ncbi:hypothetical protein VaNZ11_014710 [Volvox africanus]|uniref:ABC transporter domain-containing protein n=1 Tax=Volvox africanus TaxID=51714 RepID=A0ABQ5SKL8_9CHLO|nr:hypothetical protein VaNZ11_014710 [Volvox africanus]
MGVKFSLGNFAAVSGQSGIFTASVRTELVEGWLSSYSIITDLRVDSLKGLTADALTVPMSLDVREEASSNMLVLSVPSLQLTYQAIGSVNVSMGGTWKSLANHTLKSALRATANLDCPAYCGDYGLCEVVNGTAQCVCDCGWSTDCSRQCNLPSGFCDTEGEVASAASSTCRSNVTTSVLSNNGSCPVGYNWNSDSAKCDACPSGFSGSGCRMCLTDAGCQTRLSSSSAQCFKSTVYQLRSAAKQYECDVMDSILRGIIGNKVQFNCSTTKPAFSGASLSDLAVGSGLVSSSTPVNSTPFCHLSLHLPGMAPGAEVVCTGWACEFTAGSSQVYCPLVKCVCPNGCSSASGIFSEATFTSLRTDVRLTCDDETAELPIKDSSSCSLELSGVPIPAIAVNCKASECLDPVKGSITLQPATAEKKNPLAVAPIIAWIPTMVLLLAAMTTAAAVASFKHVAGPGPAVLYATDSATRTVAVPVTEGVENPAGLGAEQGNGTNERRHDGGVNITASHSSRAVAEVTGANNEMTVVRCIQPLPPPLLLPPPQQQERCSPLLGQLSPSLQGTPLQSEHGGCNSNKGASGSTQNNIDMGNRVAGKDDTAGPTEDRTAPGVYPGLKVQAVESGAPVTCPGKPAVQALSWHDLHLRTRSLALATSWWRPPPVATLLRGVSGIAKSGELLGILGPSGSGKTTLLSVLAGVIQPGLHWKLDGTVRIDGRAITVPGYLAALAGHVPQHDQLYRSLTVMECVISCAVLRLSSQELQRGRSSVQARVASLLRELGISYLAHRMVSPNGAATLTLGSSGGGGAGGTTLSGGELLRVAACQELVSDPPLLLLDEPLSGLDAATARAIMAVLRNVATGGTGGGVGRVVIASLHQPSPALFAALDSVLLMAGGRVAASGTPGSMTALLAAAAVPLPRHVHIAEHLLDLVISDSAQAARLCDWHDANGGPRLELAMPAPVDAVRPEDDAEYVRSLVRERCGGSGLLARLRRLWLELGVVTWRSGLDVLRNPSMLVLHVLVAGAEGLLVGAVFSNTNLNVSGAQNRVGAIFFAVMLLTCFCTSAVDSLYPERAIVDRDMLRGSYGVVPYLLAKLVLDGLLLRAVPAWAFGLPFYWLMGLRHQAAAFFTFLGGFTTLSCLAGAACIALSSIFSSPGRTVLLFNLLLLTCALFSGFLANKDSIVVWLRWIVYISPIRFCWEALVINELKPLVLSFSAPDLPEGLPAVKGSVFLSLLGVNSGMLNTDLIVLDCMYAILALMAITFASLRLAALRGRWE